MAHAQVGKGPKLPDRSEHTPINSQRRKYPDYNPYRNMAIYQDNDPAFGAVEFFEHFPILSLPDHPNDQIHVCQDSQEHRLDLIAWDFYGSHLWWWVIYLAQDPAMEDPIRDVVTGKILRIPYLPNLLLTLFR